MSRYFALCIPIYAVEQVHAIAYVCFKLAQAKNCKLTGLTWIIVVTGGQHEAGGYLALASNPAH